MTGTPPDPPGLEPPGAEPGVRALLDDRFARQERRWGRLRRRRTAVVRLGLVLAALLAAVGVVAVVHATSTSVRVLPDLQFAVPKQTTGCTGAATLASGALVVPITLRRAGSEAAMFASVCFGGQGPFPFVIDTGAATTVVDLKLAQRLHLVKSGRTQSYFGVGCSVATRLEPMAGWSVSGLRLPAQTVAVQAVVGMGGKGEPDGLLGAGTLSRFGAVRFDFTSQTMTLPGPPSAAPTKRRQVTGPSAGSIPADLLSGQPHAITGLTVVEGPIYTVAAVSIHFHGANGGVYLGLDTGSSRSVVDTSVTRVVKLAGTNVAEKEGTVCSSIVMPLVHSGAWSLGGVALAPLLIGSTDLGQLANSGLLGLFGLDALSRYRYVVVDFTDAALALGPPQS